MRLSLLRLALLACVMSALQGLVPTNAQGVTVNFDDLSLSPETYWHGPDLVNGQPGLDQFNGSVTVGSFTSGGVKFVNRSSNQYEGLWDGFAYSNTTNTTIVDYTNESTAKPATGAGPGADNYGVAFGYLDNLNPEDLSQFVHLPHLELPSGANVEQALVTNTVYSYNSMAIGDGFTGRPFGGLDGLTADWQLLTVYGVTSGGVRLANVVEFYLADFRFQDPQNDYILSQWTPIDLSPLHGAKTLYFSMSSSLEIGFMKTPAYFAIDNLQYTAVPEPSSLALILATAAGCGLLRRYRRKAVSVLR